MSTDGRAIRAAAGELHGVLVLGIAPRCDLVHVKIGDDGRLVAGGLPSCWQCSRAILDCGFIDGVWLYEEWPTSDGGVSDVWHRYTAESFHRTTLYNCGMLEV